MGDYSESAGMNDSSGQQSRGLRAFSDLSQFAVQQDAHLVRRRPLPIEDFARQELDLGHLGSQPLQAFGRQPFERGNLPQFFG